ALPAAIAATGSGRPLIVPKGNGPEAALCSEAAVFEAGSLLEVCAHLHGRQVLPRAKPESRRVVGPVPDLAEGKGQAQAKRALEVAAAGGHNLLFFGPPGTGKTMLASRLPGILPPLTEAEAVEAAAIQSLVSGRIGEDWLRRPF